jgi:hypothetical protein
MQVYHVCCVRSGGFATLILYQKQQTASTASALPARLSDENVSSANAEAKQSPDLVAGLVVLSASSSPAVSAAHVRVY